VESGNNWVRLNEPGTTHLHGTSSADGQLISEVEFLAELAHRLHGSEPIARTVPGYDAMAGIDASKREFEVSGRVFHEPRFPTATRC